MTNDSLIVRVIHRYHPTWTPPSDTGRTWIKTHCPWHLDENASAAVSYEHNGFRCMACPAKGDAIAIIMREEGVPYRAALKLAETISPGSSRELPPEPKRKSGRRVPFDPGSGVPVSDPRGDSKVPTRIRSRSTPWS